MLSSDVPAVAHCTVSSPVPTLACDNLVLPTAHSQASEFSSCARISDSSVYSLPGCRFPAGTAESWLPPLGKAAGSILQKAFPHV